MPTTQVTHCSRLVLSCPKLLSPNPPEDMLEKKKWLRWIRRTQCAPCPARAWIPLGSKSRWHLLARNPARKGIVQAMQASGASPVIAWTGSAQLSRQYLSRLQHCESMLSESEIGYHRLLWL